MLGSVHQICQVFLVKDLRYTIFLTLYIHMADTVFRAELMAFIQPIFNPNKLKETLLSIHM